MRAEVWMNAITITNYSAYRLFFPHDTLGFIVFILATRDLATHRLGRVPTPTRNELRVTRTRKRFLRKEKQNVVSLSEGKAMSSILPSTISMYLHVYIYLCHFRISSLAFILLWYCYVIFDRSLKRF